MTLAALALLTLLAGAPAPEPDRAQPGAAPASCYNIPRTPWRMYHEQRLQCCLAHPRWRRCLRPLMREAVRQFRQRKP